MRDRRTIFSVFGTLICIAFTLHVLLAVVIIIRPEASRINPVLKFYRRFVVLGPFFQQSRIESKSHLLVSQFSNGTWSEPTDYACEDVADSHVNRYAAIQRRSFEVFLTEHAASATKQKERARALIELEKYLRLQERFSNADSIAIVGVRRGLSDKNADNEVVIVQHKFER